MWPCRGRGQRVTDARVQQVARFCWRALVAALIALAIYITCIRALIKVLPDYQTDVTQALSQALGYAVQVHSLEGHLHGFSPVVHVDRLRVFDSEAQDSPLEVNQATWVLDPWASLLALQPRLALLQLGGVTARWHQREQSTGAPDVSGKLLSDVMTSLRHVSLSDAEITLVAADGTELSVLLSMDLQVQGSERQLQFLVSSPDGFQASGGGRGIGNPFEVKNFEGEFFGRLNIDHMAPLMPFLDVPLEGSGDLDFWYTVRDGLPQLTFSVGLRDLRYAAASERELKLDGLSFRAAVVPREGVSVAYVEALQAVVEESVFSLERMGLTFNESALAVTTGAIDIGALVDLIQTQPLAPKATDILSELAPSGEITALSAEMPDWRRPQQDWSATAAFEDLSIQPFLRAPGLGGIDATIEASANGAIAWIDTEAFSFELPAVFPAAIPFERVLGQLHASWKHDALFLDQGRLLAEAGDHRALVELNMDIALNKASPTAPITTMNLAVGFDDMPVAARTRYTPSRLPATLYQWLDDAIESGQVDGGVFFWRGRFDKYGQGGQSVQLGIDLQDVHLRFHPDWPLAEVATARLLLDTDRASIWSDHAEIAALPVRAISAEIGRDQGISALELKGYFDGATEGALDLLRRSPVAFKAGAVLSDLSATGDAQGVLNLRLDMAELAAPVSLDVTVDVADNALHSKTLDLTLEQLTGRLHFNVSTGFQSENLSAALWSETVAIVVEQGTTRPNDRSIFDGELKTRVHSANVDRWLSGDSAHGWAVPASAKPIEGTTLIDVDVFVGETTEITVSADLEDMAVAFPSPLGKARSQPGNITFNVNLAEDAPWSVNWNDTVSAQIYRQGREIIGARVDATPGAASDQLLAAPATSGLIIGGHLPSLNLGEWVELTRNITSDLQGDSSGRGTSLDRLTIDDTRLGDVELGATVLDLTPYDDWDMLGINAEWVDAELTLERNRAGASLIVNRLDLDAWSAMREPDLDPPEVELESEQAIGEATKMSTSSAAPPDLPFAMNVIVANLVFGGDNQGAVSFRLESDASAMFVSEITGNLAEVSLDRASELKWQILEDGTAVTSMTLDAQLEDLRRTLESLDVDPVIENRSGQILGQLAWPGTPMDFGLLALSGELNVDIRRGSFLPVPAGTNGFLRIISLINLSGLFERANVTRLFDPGVAFRKAKGQFVFDAGMLRLPNFVVDGTSGGFALSSDIDLAQQTVDGELVVTLPLAENIPWVAAIAGGLPIAAGAYLASKLFKDEVKSLSSGVYSVTGDLAKPEVKFIRIFDAKGSGAQGESQPVESEESNASNESSLSDDESGDSESSKARQ